MLEFDVNFTTEKAQDNIRNNAIHGMPHDTRGKKLSIQVLLFIFNYFYLVLIFFFFQTFSTRRNFLT